MRYWAIMCTAVVCKPGREVNLIFLIKPFFLHDQRISSVKWSDPGHFLKAQGKFIF